MSDIAQTVNRQREFFNSGASIDLAFRAGSLKKLQAEVSRRKQDILNALASDLGKSETEATMTELNIFDHEIRYLLKNLNRLASRRRVSTTLSLMPARSYVTAQPYGVVCIMSPWNYPFLLTMQPLAGALAAGNCAIVKPSAYSPATSKIVSQIIEACFDSCYCTVITGGRKENSELLEQHFDYIFFTGSVAVGKLVMEKASHHLTPVTLELGGKSPVIVDDTADLEVTAKRLVFGKFINAGQTCVAPDYIFVSKARKQQLIEKLIKWIKISYPADEDEKITDFPRIINEKHFDRIRGLLENQHIIYGGRFDRQTRFISPTIVDDVDENSPLMQQEIFGPIFPILTYDNIDEVFDFIRLRPRPLALYLFSNDRRLWKYIESNITFGSGCINDCVVHLSNHHLPFGGIGNSGMGHYHGKYTFETFTHYKSIVNKSVRLDFPQRYRPYDEKAAKLLRKL